jgi:SAM-dependent methyltransferase
MRDLAVQAGTVFVPVEIEAGRFPAADAYFDVVVWNREMVTVKNIEPVLAEIRRILRPGGLFVLSVPNLAALHNRLLLLAGRQPTTLHVGHGDHVRGFVVPSLTRFLRQDMGFQVLKIVGVGLAPVSGARLPASLRNISHTAVWVLRNPAS